MTTTETIRLDYPDDEVKKRVSSFLHSRNFPAFRHLDVAVENGQVTLSGEVCSFYEKQVALNSCQRVPGVLQLVDDIAVHPAELLKPAAK